MGKWNLMYEDGQTGTFTFSKNDDRTPKFVVSDDGGRRECRQRGRDQGRHDYLTREIAVQGLAGSVTYTAKLVEGALKGTGDVKLGDVGTPTPFPATRAK